MSSNEVSQDDWEGFWEHLYNFHQAHPSPKLWAVTTGNTIPEAFIYGTESHLQRPESVAFSPSGRFMAVANTGNWELVLYQTHENGCPADSKMVPCAFYANLDNFDFLHDAEFFGSDEHILVVAAQSNTIAHIRVSTSASQVISLSLESCISGMSTMLNFPTSISICPTKGLLAVANRREAGILVYSVDLQRFTVRNVPTQQLRQDYLSATLGLAPPHCLAFSPDAKYLFVTHKEFWESGNLRGKCAVAIYCCSDDLGQPIRPEPVFVLSYDHAPTIHSIAVHPNGHLIAVANSIEYPGPSAAADVDILLWEPSSPSLKRVYSISVFRLWEGAKGVSFSPDGTHLSISTELNQILIYSLPADLLSLGSPDSSLDMIPS